MANSAEWKVVPLAASVNQRYTDTSLDGLMTNGYLQKDVIGNLWTRRRAGFRELPGLVPDGTYSALGVFVPKSSSLNYIVGADQNIYSASLIAYTFSTLANSNLIWFDESTTTTLNEIYASNGTEGAYQTTVASFTRITDSNYPAITLNGSAYLNGYLYVLDKNGSVWGTPNQNDFSTWSSTNVINAWGTNGTAIAIRSYLNEVIVFKSFSLEVFYDSGNSVGSPLLPVQQINIKWGCIRPSSIVKIDSEIFWEARSETSDYAIIRMNNFIPTPISNEAINRYLNPSTNTGVVTNGAYACTMGGDNFYCISTTLGGVSKIFSYNLASNEWSIFNSTMYGNATIANGTTLGAVVNTAGQPLVIDDTLTNDRNHVPGNTRQVPTAISMHLRTDNFDSGTMLRKMVSGLRLRADQKSASSIRIRWSDDDYQTWSAWRSIDLSKSVPMLPGLQGTFSKRAYEIEYSGADPIRISHMELLIALGDI